MIAITIAKDPQILIDKCILIGNKFNLVYGEDLFPLVDNTIMLLLQNKKAVYAPCFYNNITIKPCFYDFPYD